MTAPETTRKGALGVISVIAATGLAVAGCGASTSTSESTTAAPTMLTVFAAASLTDTFTELGKEFEAKHAGVTVRFTFDGSSGLVAKLLGGAPADILATADQKTMTKATSSEVTTGNPQIFARNVLTIATAPGNPKKITGLADLARPDLAVVVCAPAVPCGAATATVTKDVGVTLRPKSEENAVTGVLAKVESGQADAGLVYVTDTKSAGDAVTAVPFPEAQKAVNTYPIALAKPKGAPAAAEATTKTAQEFIAFVLGNDGRTVLKDAGFQLP